MSISGDNYSLKPLEERHAWDILSWEYPFPYDFYNTSFDNHQEHYVRQFVDPDLKFHAVLDSYGTMVGFCSFGADGQVPGVHPCCSILGNSIAFRPSFSSFSPI